MRGLIIKDIFILKKNVKIFVVLIVLYVFMSFASNDTSFFNSVITMLFAILILNLYAFDDAAKWDSFALTLPISKDNIVQEKYLMMLLLTMTGSAVCSIFTIISNITRKSDSIFHGFEIIGIGAVVVIIFYSIILPAITKLGVEKARIIIFAIYLIPFVIFMALKKMQGDIKLPIPGTLLKLVDLLIKNIFVVLSLTAVIALLVSYEISIRIYRKKEF